MKKQNKAHENLNVTIDKKSFLNIPVFFHIPKNAGTYFIGVMIIFLRLFRRERTDWLKNDHESIKDIEVYSGDKYICRFICGDPNNSVINSKIFVPKDDVSVHYKCELKKLKPIHLKQLMVFSIVFESDGFGYYQKVLNLMNYGKFKFQKCMILRDPFERAQSMFNYLSNKKSSGHEPTFKSMSKRKFETYIDSDFVEDSWLIRAFLSLGNHLDISQEDYEKVDELLYDFICVDISNTDKLIDLIFRRTYNYTIKSIPEGWLEINTNQNKSLGKKLLINNICEKHRVKFLERTRFDRNLWLHHCLK